MPGNNLGSLVFDIQADVASLKKDMRKATGVVTKSTDRMVKSANRARKALGGIAGALIARAGLGSIVSATREQEQAVKQLEQGLATTGNAVGQSLAELTKKAAELQNATTFGDEDIIRAQSQLVSFTKVTGDEFDRTIELAADLSARFGTDLKSSVLQLGKALNDPVKNLSALSRAGIQFSESQTTLIKKLVASGQQVKAQQLILKELEVQFGGSARAAADTFGGALDQLGNAAGDLLEGDDGLVGVKENIQELTAVLQDPQIKEGISTFVNGLLTGLGEVVKLIATVTTGFKNLGEALAINANGFGGLDLEETKARIAEVRYEILQIKSDPFEGLTRSAKGLTVELEKLLEQEKLLEDLGTLNIGGATGKDGKSGGGSTPDTKTAEGQKDLVEATKETEAAMKDFQKALESARDAVNGANPKLTAENVQFSDLTRLTAEARIAAVGGDKEKALGLAEEGAKAAQLLKESGKESGLVISGALRKLEGIAERAVSPAAKDAVKKEPVKGVLEIKAEITSADGEKSLEFTGSSDEQVGKFLEAFGQSLVSQVAAVRG